MADISILIPWRTDHGHRQHIYDRLMPLWTDSGFDIQVGIDDYDGPFNINRALNRARTQATGQVLVVMGADHIPDPDHIRASAHDMLEQGLPWAQLYERRAVLTPRATRSVLAGADPYRHWRTAKTSAEAPGIVAAQAHVWDDLGGRDERFAGWGGEDRAYQAAITTLHGPPLQCAGVVRDLWHRPTRQRTPGNHTLVAAYAAADGDTVAMRAVLAGAPATRTT